MHRFNFNIDILLGTRNTDMNSLETTDYAVVEWAQ